MPNTLYQTDGSMDFIMGVDSGRTTLLQSSSNPNGLRRDQLAWLDNGTVRQGGITQRAGWKYLTTIHDGSAIYQGGIIYEPVNELPYLVTSIGGKIYRTDPFAGAATVDLSAAYGLSNPPGVDQAFFCQGEEFLIIQAGDNVTNPLFWYDIGTSQLLRRSNGFQFASSPNNEIPAATCMDYYQNRLWYAQYRTYSAGDIVGGVNGTIGFGFRDAILHVTENPLAIGGDGFTVPTFAGNIRALAHAANLDTALGTTPLFVFTRKDVYALKVPITRTDWISAGKALAGKGPDDQPEQRVIQKKYGTSGERSVVAVNGDLIYQTLEPGIRSLAMAVRFSNQWANTAISRNVDRALRFNDRSLLRFGSGMLFDNRIWQTCLPYQSPVGVAHKGVVTLNFDLVSSYQDKVNGSSIPAWEGIYDGLNILQLFSYEFGGLDRAFATVIGNDGTIQLWELTQADRFENEIPAQVNSGNRVQWQIEFPAFPCKDATELKELQAADIWIDREYGIVEFEAWYRSDFDPCWHWWHKWQKCVTRTSCEDVQNPVCYPVTEYREGYELPMTLPHPPTGCDSLGNAPAFQGHFFQVKLIIKGFCRVRGILIYASHVDQPLYGRKVC